MSKKKEKVSFLFEYKFIDYFDDLAGDEIKQILKDMVDYDKYDKEPFYQDRTMKTIWKLIKSVMKENKNKYKETCEQNKINQEKRWAKRKNTTEYERILPNTNVSSGIKKSEKDTDIDIDLDNNVCIYNSDETNICHLENKFKIEACKECSKRYMCKNPTDPDFKLRKGCDFEEWLAKHQNFAEQVNSQVHDPPKDYEMEELNDYNWYEDE